MSHIVSVHHDGCIITRFIALLGVDLQDTDRRIGYNVRSGTEVGFFVDW